MAKSAYLLLFHFLLSSFFFASQYHLQPNQNTRTAAFCSLFYHFDSKTFIVNCCPYFLSVYYQSFNLIDLIKETGCLSSCLSQISSKLLIIHNACTDRGQDPGRPLAERWRSHPSARRKFRTLACRAEAYFGRSGLLLYAGEPGLRGAE